ncbi:MAG: recombinase family protein [Planctomycetota bacterium]|nr:recombinase family protein [Planctomycetota bacterium]
MTNHPPNLIRYAIYTRQSVEKTDDLGSCEVQFITCRNHVQATGEANLYWTGQRFDDEGYSGATLDRPAMRKLRKVIDLGGIDRLYAVALDRLSRSMRDSIVLLNELDKAGVDLKLVHQSELTSGSENRFLRHVLAAFAEFERDMIATRIAESRAYLKKHGRRLAGPPPYGYDADPVTKQLVPNAPESRRVRSIFKHAAAGKRPKQIAFVCNKQRWTTKVRVARRSGKTVGGGRWTARQILAVLTNPVYVGQFATDDKPRPGCHEPIVGRELFDQVQGILAGRRTTERRGRRRQGFPLRQKLICPRCGRMLTTYTITKKTTPLSGLIYRYYSCRSNAGGRARCKGIQYSAYDIEVAARDMLSQPDVWQEILGPGAPSQDAHSAAQAWGSLLWPRQMDFIGRYVQRIELRRKKSEMSITFDPAVREAFSADLQTFREPAG